MGPIAAEKRTAMLRYSRLQRLTTLLRCLELLALALLAFWSSTQIPAAARSSGDLLRRLLPVLLGPRFLFLLGNAIVITLLLKSRHLSTTTADASDADATSTTIGDEISAFVSPLQPPQQQQLPTPAVAAAEVVFEDKKVCVEGPPRACRRSASERVGERRRRSPELRRSETEVGKEEEENEEEFRQTIEAFIAKQRKFQRNESMAIVCSSDGLTCSAGTLEAKEIIT